MDQSESLYTQSPALQLLDPWMRKHLPAMDEAAKRRLIQLTAGIFEKRSVLVEVIAESLAFGAETVSNETQGRRLIRDVHINAECVYYPMVGSLLRELASDVVYLTMDETCHGTA